MQVCVKCPDPEMTLLYYLRNNCILQNKPAVYCTCRADTFFDWPSVYTHVELSVHVVTLYVTTIVILVNTPINSSWIAHY